MCFYGLLHVMHLCSCPNGRIINPHNDDDGKSIHIYFSNHCLFQLSLLAQRKQHCDKLLRPRSVGATPPGVGHSWAAHALPWQAANVYLSFSAPLRGLNAPRTHGLAGRVLYSEPHVRCAWPINHAPPTLPFMADCRDVTQPKIWQCK